MESELEPVQTTEDGRTITCITCGKPLRRFQASYTVAYDDEKAVGEHWACHTPAKVALQRAEDKLKEVQKSMDRLKGLFK